MHLFIVAGLLCFALTWSTAPVFGAPFGYTFESGVLQRVDLETGDRVDIGPTGVELVALAFGEDGQLVATDGTGLYGVDRSSGNTQLIVALDTPLADVTGLAFDMTARLWVSATTAADSEGLYQIDTESGTVSHVIPLAPAALAARGDRLFAFGEDLVAIDLEMHTVATLGSGFETWVTPGVWGPFRRGSGADFDSSGRAWGLRDNVLEIDPPAAFVEIAQFDESGRLTNLVIDHQYGQGDVSGLAIAPPERGVVDIPTLDTRSIGVLVLVLALAGGVLIRTRGRSPLP